MVECLPSKQDVASSNLVSRSKCLGCFAPPGFVLYELGGVISLVGVRIMAGNSRVVGFCILTWSNVATIGQQHDAGVNVLLANGTVLLVGGQDSAANKTATASNYTP